MLNSATLFFDSKALYMLLPIRPLFSVTLGLALLFTFFQPQSGFAQGEVKEAHGEWEIRCETPPGARSEQCALLQFVVADDRPNVGLTVIVLKTADKQANVLRVLAPLGVLLPSGLGLRIDEDNLGNAAFVRCLPEGGCVAEIVMDEKLINNFKSGKVATFVIFQTPEEGIGIPIELNGFTAGFDALSKL